MTEPETVLDGLHPLLREAAARRRLGPQYAELSIAQARRLSRERLGAPSRLPVLTAVTDLSLPGPDGALAGRLFRPSSKASLPLIVYFHGGGFICGDLDSHDTIVRRLAIATGALVVALDYRLAPEHPFPAAIEDGVSALRHVMDHAPELGAHPGRIFVGGDSAGAAIAMAAAGTAGGVAGLMLFYPVADLANIGKTTSYAEFGDGCAGLSLADMQWSARNYAPNLADRTDWRCSPLYVGGSVQLPPVFIATARFDVLRSEGEALAARLAALGIRVRHHRAEAVSHGYLGAGAQVPEVQRTLDAVAHWLDAQ